MISNKGEPCPYRTSSKARQIVVNVGWNHSPLASESASGPQPQEQTAAQRHFPKTTELPDDWGDLNAYDAYWALVEKARGRRGEDAERYARRTVERAMANVRGQLG